METKEQRIARQTQAWKERKLEQVYETGKGWYTVLEPATHIMPGPVSLDYYEQTHSSADIHKYRETAHLNSAIERATALGQDRSLTDYTPTQRVWNDP